MDTEVIGENWIDNEESFAIFGILIDLAYIGLLCVLAINFIRQRKLVSFSITLLMKIIKGVLP